MSNPEPRKPFRFVRRALVGLVVGPSVMFAFSFLGIGLGLGHERNEALIRLVLAGMFAGAAVAIASGLYLLGWLLFRLVGRL